MAYLRLSEAAQVLAIRYDIDYYDNFPIFVTKIYSLVITFDYRVCEVIIYLGIIHFKTINVYTGKFISTGIFCL